MTNKNEKHTAYWITTGILVFCMTGGFFELAGAQATVDGIQKLGYPAYIIPVLGLAKVLAIAAILWPGLPRLKEWAYAGLFFNMMNLTIAAIILASWALRPASRRLGEIRPLEVAAAKA
jgi:hypothetical protein